MPLRGQLIWHGMIWYRCACNNSISSSCSIPHHCTHPGVWNSRPSRSSRTLPRPYNASLVPPCVCSEGMHTTQASTTADVALLHLAGRLLVCNKKAAGPNEQVEQYATGLMNLNTAEKVSSINLRIFPMCRCHLIAVHMI